MNYSTADTIAYRLSKVSPWIFDEESRMWDRPEYICMFCEFTRPVNEYGTHARDCIWQMAKDYAVGVNDSPVASQEPAESPIKSRVSELLGEADFSHLHSLEMRLEREREFLTHAKTPSETRARQVWISQTEKEIQCEREHLGIDTMPEMTDDELLAELTK